jgi:hypothetical protein
MGRTINSAGKTGKRRPLKGTTTKLRRGPGTARGHSSSDVAQEPETAGLAGELGDALQRQSAHTLQPIANLAGHPHRAGRKPGR